MNSIKILDESNLSELDVLVDKYLEEEGFKLLEEAIKDRENFLSKIEDIKYRDDLSRYVNADILSLCSSDESGIIFIDGYGGGQNLSKNRDILRNHSMDIIEASLILSVLSKAKKVFLGILHDCRLEVESYDRIIKVLKEKNVFKNAGVELEVFPLSRDIIDGEKTSVFEYTQGRRGCPTMDEESILLEGIDGKPTLMVDLETVLDFKVSENRNSMLISIVGDVNKAGLKRVAYGTTFRDIVKDDTNMNILKGIYLGGPLGLPLSEEEMDLTYDLESFEKLGFNFVPREITVLSNDRNILDLNKRFAQYFVEKSCGKCTPCREGTTRILEVYEKILDRRADAEDLERLEELSETLRCASYCKFGEMASNLYLEGFKRFVNDYREYVQIDMSSLSGDDKDEE